MDRPHDMTTESLPRRSSREGAGGDGGPRPPVPVPLRFRGQDTLRRQKDQEGSDLCPGFGLEHG